MHGHWRGPSPSNEGGGGCVTEANGHDSPWHMDKAVFRLSLRSEFPLTVPVTGPSPAS